MVSGNAGAQLLQFRFAHDGYLFRGKNGMGAGAEVVGGEWYEPDLSGLNAER
jgi:hypothetical protein